VIETIPGTVTGPTTVLRFGYLTTDMAKFGKARELGHLDGVSVDLVPADAPAPEPGTFDGLLADFAPNARHALERETFLKKLVRLAKDFPVVVFDQTMSYRETNVLRAAGIKWFPVPTARAFPILRDRARSRAAARTAPEVNAAPAPEEPVISHQ
jgi:hypothetical protein